MRTTLRQWRFVFLALVLATAGIGACGDDDDSGGDVAGSTTSTTAADGESASIPIVTVTTSEVTENEDGIAFAFDIAQDLTAGPTQINLRNDSGAPHHVQIYRLNDDATMEQFGAALEAGDIGGMLAIGAFVGGTGTTDPKTESDADALIDLTEGNYVLLCFVEDENGVPHLALGMVEPFSVAPATGDVARMPEPDATIDMVDFGYESSELPANGIVEVVNTSDEQLHEMNLLQLADGATATDAAAFFEAETPGPPPFGSVGGMQALMPKGSQFLVLEDAEPGDYVMICLIPDPSDEVPHAQKGMALGATVS